MVLDCGEDKDDSHPEYGGTVCCHNFRLNQTEFIKSVLKNAESEHLADGVEWRVIISHIPFTFNCGGEFEIETDIYSEWAKLIEKSIKPDLMIQAHIHTISVNEKGSAFDSYGIQPCTVAVASRLDDGGFSGCGFTFDENKILIESVSDKGERRIEKSAKKDK